MALVSEKCRVEEGRFFRLYEENARPLVRFFQRKGVPAERARELSQETFLRLCRNTGGLSTARNEKGYLFATARNLWCNTVRDRHAAKRFAEVVSLDETSEVGPLSNRLSSSEPGDNPVDVLLEKERREILRQAIHRLPTMMRLCMARSIYLGETISEIAEALGIAEGTVKSHMFHARARLRSDCTPAAAASTGRRKPPPRNPRQSP